MRNEDAGEYLKRALYIFLLKNMLAALKKSVESEAECPRRLSAAYTRYVRKAAGAENEAIGDLLRAALD